MQCLGLTGACAACSHCTATAWELSGLDHSHAATPQHVMRASCAQLLRSILGAACLSDLVCLKLLVGVCVRDRLAASVCVYYSAILLLTLSFFLGVGAPSLSLAGYMFKAAQCGSFSFFVAASAACVYETDLNLLFAYVALLRLPLSSFPGVGRAVAFPRWLQVLSCPTWLIVRCCINSSSCVLASLALIVIV